MTIRSMNRHATQPNWLECSGDPIELVRTADYTHEDFADFVAGFAVTSSQSGRHDGHPALLFTLADDFGRRPVGRLVLRTDLGFHEEDFEWTRVYTADADAIHALERFKNPTPPSVVRTQMDLCWDGYETLDEAIADFSAIYGISITVKNPHGPGGGWPVVELMGKRDNVREALLTGWQIGEDELVEYGLAPTK